MLTNRSTQLHFDDFLSNLIYIHNGTTQGCPLSMILYAYHNTDLIYIVKGKCELSTGFIDDCAFVAVVDTLDSVHHILRDMMEQPNGGFDWSQSHNSPFELSKLVVMDFARTPSNIASSPLHIDKTNPNRTTTHHIITTTTDYKYLGMIFDPKLNWRAHASNVVAKVTKWIQQLWRLARWTGGIPPGQICQLYNMVVVLAFTYASNVWYVPPFKLTYKRNSLGSISVTKILHSVQGQAARFITGGLKDTAYDVLEVHAYIPPVDLLLHKTQMSAATHICTLPTSHPLTTIAC